LPSNLPRPCLYSVPGGVLSLSGPALQEFLRAVLARGAPFRFKARGVSMHPFIRDGDVVTVSPGTGRKPRLGEVAAFCHPETRKLVVHRVLARLDGAYLLQGDNSPISDGVIPSEAVLGLVTRVERHGRTVRFGGGLARLPIAFLSRRDLLQPVIFRARQALRPLLRRAPT
jgi:hypothetical protein